MGRSAVPRLDILVAVSLLILGSWQGMFTLSQKITSVCRWWNFMWSYSGPYLSREQFIWSSVDFSSPNCHHVVREWRISAAHLGPLNSCLRGSSSHSPNFRRLVHKRSSNSADRNWWCGFGITVLFTFTTFTDKLLHRPKNWWLLSLKSGPPERSEWLVFT